MNDSSNTGRVRRYLLIGSGAIAGIVLIGWVWMVALAPSPTDFAGGAHVALTGYHGADPTGIPPELRSASLIERGEYLARAADCAACHTADGGAPYAGGRAFVLHTALVADNMVMLCGAWLSLVLLRRASPS